MPLFPYEKPMYGNLMEADSAANRRSLDFGQIMDYIMGRHKEMAGLGGPQQMDWQRILQTIMQGQSQRQQPMQYTP